MAPRCSVEGGAPTPLQESLRMAWGAGVVFGMLFIPAGRVDWLSGWLYVLIWAVHGIAQRLWLLKEDPALVQERTAPGETSKQWDIRLIMASLPLRFSILLVAGLDAGRFGWSELPMGLQVLGFFGFIPAMVLADLAFHHNQFASSVVRVQTDRGHVVVSTGPYRRIRHPMYLSSLISTLCAPLALGSGWALIPAAMYAGLTVTRTWLEDRTLRTELAGYAEYAEKVRHRLIPGAW